MQCVPRCALYPNKRLGLAAVDTSLRELHDGPHVFCGSPTLAFELPSRIRSSRISMVVLSDLDSSRRSIVRGLMGVKKHGVAERSLSKVKDQASLSKIVERYRWEEAALSSPTCLGNARLPNRQECRGGTFSSTLKALQERQLSHVPSAASKTAW